MCNLSTLSTTVWTTRCSNFRNRLELQLCKLCPTVDTPVDKGTCDDGDMESGNPLPVHSLDPTGMDAAGTDEYRRLSAEAAAGVAVISTARRHHDYAATVTAFHSVSYDPPTMLVSLYEGSRIAEAVVQTGKWAISLLPAGARGVANWLASPGAPVEGLLTQVKFHRTGPGGCAIIDGALAFFEVETFAVHEAATHVVILGHVVGMGAQASNAADMDQAGTSRGPLVHYGGSYRTLAP